MILAIGVKLILVSMSIFWTLFSLRSSLDAVRIIMDWWWLLLVLPTFTRANAGWTSRIQDAKLGKWSSMDIFANACLAFLTLSISLQEMKFSRWINGFLRNEKNIDRLKILTSNVKSNWNFWREVAMTWKASRSITPIRIALYAWFHAFDANPIRAYNKIVANV